MPFLVFYRICKKVKKKAKCVNKKSKEEDSVFGEGKYVIERYCLTAQMGINSGIILSVLLNYLALNAST